MAATCPTAADAAFPSSSTDCASKRASLEALNGNARKIVKFAGDGTSGLAGFSTLYLQMDPELVPGLKDLQERFQAANRKLIENFEGAISDLGIAGQIPTCFGDTNSSILANTWDADHADLVAAKEKAELEADGYITVSILILPRKDRAGEINSIHFVVIYRPNDDDSLPRVIVSYNYQKGEGFSAHYEDVRALWKKRGITKTAPPGQRNCFERLWESTPANAAASIRDVTQWANYLEDEELVDATFPTSAGTPGRPVYEATWAIEIQMDNSARDIDVKLETTHNLAAAITKRGTVASGGPHVGSFNCLYAGCSALAEPGQPLLGLPINEAFAALAAKATRGYKATEDSLWVKDFVERKLEVFEPMEPSDVLAEVNAAFAAKNLNTSRGEGRAAYASQYINFRGAHSDPDWMACAKIIAEAGVTVLEDYAANPDSDELKEIFGV
jgi:hypothetical protein